MPPKRLSPAPGESMPAFQRRATHHIYERYSFLHSREAKHFLQNTSVVFRDHYSPFMVSVLDHYVPALHHEFMWRIIRCELCHDAYMEWMNKAMHCPRERYYPYAAEVHASISTLCYSIMEARYILNAMKINAVRQCLYEPNNLRRFAAPYGRKGQGAFALPPMTCRRLQLAHSIDFRALVKDKRQKIMRFDESPHNVCYRKKQPPDRYYNQLKTPSLAERSRAPNNSRVSPRTMDRVRYRRDIRSVYRDISQDQFLRVLDMDMRTFTGKDIQALKRLQRVVSQYHRKHNDVFKERYRIQNSEMYITLFPFAYFNHFLYKLEKINDMLDRMESNLILQHFQVDCKLGHSNTIWEYHKMGPRIRTWMHLLHQRKQEQGNEEKYTEDEETRRLNLRQALRWEGRYDLLMVYSPTNSSYANLYDIPWADRRNPAGTPVPDTPQMSPEGRYRLFSLIEKAETTEEKKYGSMQPWASPSTSVMKNVEENADFYRRPLAYQWPHQRKMTIRNEPEHASVFPPLVSRSTTKTTPNSALSRESPSNTEESSSRKDVSANLSASLTTSNDILQYMREKTGKQRRQWKDYMEKQGENDDTDDDTRQRIIQNLRLRLRETQKQHGVLSILKDEDEGNESDVSVHTP